ncbi:MAG: hypothetical protein HY006_03490 [Candidatus Sungbacteria bacterium]|nr:hypothetical protein [Candidatus Sungbacteria bacterium]
MKNIPIIGLTGNPKKIQCHVSVLGDPSLSDPAIASHTVGIEELAAVSWNGAWLAIVRGRASAENDTSILTVCRAQEGAEEIVAVRPPESRCVIPRDIRNDGTLLFEADLGNPNNASGFSRRAVLFEPGQRQTVILPPPFNQEDLFDDDPMRKGVVRSHTPLCFTPNGNVFCWAYKAYDVERGIKESGLLNCFWYQHGSAGWDLEYGPPYLEKMTLWPAGSGMYIWCTRIEEGSQEMAHVGLFNGKGLEIFNDVTLPGHSHAITAVAANNIFFGHLFWSDGKSQESGSGEKFNHFPNSFLVDPQRQAMHIFNDGAKNNPFLEGISENGHYLIGTKPDVGFFLMQAAAEGYSFGLLDAPGWRIEDAVHVNDECHVFALATCVDRKHGCFRLKLPVKLIPQL